MLPLWMGSGPGAEERRAVAVMVIGGQTLSLLLTLLVTPVVHTLLDDLGLLTRPQKLLQGMWQVLCLNLDQLLRRIGRLCVRSWGVGGFVIFF